MLTEGLEEQEDKIGLAEVEKWLPEAVGTNEGRSTEQVLLPPL
ncbi:hypothetical protein GCM10025794_32610 [Massilia kyonggiensis]